MKTQEGYDKALAEFKDKPLNGSPLLIEPARSKPTQRSYLTSYRRNPNFNYSSYRSAESSTYQPQSTPSLTVYVSNLPPGATNEDIAEVFKDLKIRRTVATGHINHRTGKSYGFVEFETEEDLQSALAMNGNVSISGEMLTIERARR